MQTPEWRWKPSAFLRHLRSLAGTSKNDEGMIRELRMRRLPQEVQRILMAQRDLLLDKVAEIDTIVEAPVSSCFPSSSVNAAVAYTDVQLLGQQMDDLIKKMVEFIDSQGRLLALARSLLLALVPNRAGITRNLSVKPQSVIV
ncbi:jg4499 [Pararge aegeria aegeria]|uniref:Jg4499 protein n=1 Tax=Pararge aegeria aegeria TaxID=348720 RepID=A0A8S4R6C3_9NEOP|nr:jg4499 [Pararge aegeria aegeria]